MSNLGGYQTVVEAIKAVGGPKKALGIGIAALGAVGSAGYALGESGIIRKGLKSLRSLNTTRESDPRLNSTFTVHTRRQDSGGPLLNPGMKFNVIAIADEAVTIEVIGHLNNPFVMSDASLSDISDFPLDGTSQRKKR